VDRNEANNSFDPMPYFRFAAEDYSGFRKTLDAISKVIKSLLSRTVA
jgi:hypothetical protein